VGINRDSDLAGTFAEAGRRVGQALSDLLDSIQPAVDAVTTAAKRPEVQAVLGQAERLLRRRPCLCFCARSHPDDQSICEMFDAVVTGQHTSDLLGDVAVPLCAPCAAARAAHEFASSR
jgi:hypothetical protein